MSTSLTTAKVVLFDSRSTADGGAGDATNLAGQGIGRILGYYVTNDVASPGAISVFINSQTLARELAPGVTMVFSKQGKIHLVEAQAASTATVYTGVMSE